MPATDTSGHNINRGSQRKRGLPLLPSVITLLLLPVLIGLGVWQLQRMQWKTALLADMAAASHLPPLALGTAPIPAHAAFRQLSLALACPAQTPQAEAGRNMQGQSGWAFSLLCRHHGQAVQLVIGWHDQADGWKAAALAPLLHAPVTVSGLAVPGSHADWRLIATTAPPPLVPVALPTPADIPNNHLGYALQWFAFAAILLVIYAITCVRWRLASRSDSE